jgi:hypothetical protein
LAVLNIQWWGHRGKAMQGHGCGLDRIMERNVKGVMEMTHCRGQRELVCLHTNALEDFERAKALPIQFLGGARCSNIAGVQPYHIARFKLDGLVLGIVVFGLIILRSLNILDELFVNLMEMGREILTSPLHLKPWSPSMLSNNFSHLGSIMYGVVPWITFDGFNGASSTMAGIQFAITLLGLALWYFWKRIHHATGS